MALHTKPAVALIGGTVHLLDCQSAAVGGKLVTIEIRQAGTTTVLESTVVTLTSGGHFSFTTAVANGTYDITAKGSHWLRQKRTRQVIGTTGLSNLSFFLVNADVNGNNVVSLADFAALNAAMGTSSGDPAWNVEADLNCDGTVSLADYAILRKNYGRMGDYVLGSPIDIPLTSPFGYLPYAMTFPGWMEHVLPTDSSSAPGGGPSSAISVDLAFGVVDVDTGVDLIASNPNGSDIVFARRYRTALAAGNVSSPGLSAGWTHNWDFRIVPLSTGAWSELQLVYPNGGSETITPDLDGDGNPTGNFTVPSGAPYVATAVAGANHRWTSITLHGNGVEAQVFAMPSQDSVYRLQTEVEATGTTINLTYSNGVLTRIDNASGGPISAQLDLTYNGAGLLEAVTDPWGARARTYSYGGNGLSSLSRINSTSLDWIFEYTAVGGRPYISAVKTPDPHGSLSQASVTYDALTGRAAATTDAKGNSRAYAYIEDGGGTASVKEGGTTIDQSSATTDADGRQLTSKNASGDATTFEYGSVDPSVITQVARPLGNPMKVETDSHGNTTKITYPYGNYTEITWEYAPDAPGVRHGRVKKVQQFGRSGEVKQPIQYTYYSAGEADGVEGFLKEVAYPYGGYEIYTYTAKGNVATVSGPTTQITYGYTVKYGNVAAPERLGLPYSVTDLLGRKTWFDYDNAGNLVWTRDPMGNESSVEHNDYGQPLEVNLPMQRHLQLSYAIAGKAPVSATLSGNGQQINLFQNSYDPESALHQATDANGHSNTANLDGQFGLSQLVNGNSKPMHSFTPLPYTRQFQASIGTGARSWNHRSNFDQNGCLSQSGPVPGLASDGITAVVQPNSATGLRDFPREIQVTLNSSVRGTGRGDTSYGYDGFGRITSINTVQQGSPASGASFFTTGSNSYQYDDLDRIVVGNGIIYGYYPDGTRHYMVAGPGQENGGTAPWTIYVYTYDSAQRLIRIEVDASTTPSPAGVAYTVVWADYSYDANDRVVAVRTPRAVTLYTYDSLGQVTKLENLSPDNVYDPFSLKRTTEPNGIGHTVISTFTNITYDPQGNRTGMDFEAAVKVGYGPTTAEPEGKRTSYKSGHVSFGYDTAGRLTSEEWSGFGATRALGHAYDAAGNLQVLRNETWGTDLDSDQTTGSGRLGYGTISYDDSGQTTLAGGTTAGSNQYTYLVSGQPISAIGRSVYTFLSNRHSFQESFAYDAEGRRTIYSVENAIYDYREDYYFYDGPMLVMRTTNAAIHNGQAFMPSDLPNVYPFNPSPVVAYLWGPTGPIMEYNSKGESRTFIYDPQGSCLATAGRTGKIYENELGAIVPVDGVAEDPIFYDGYGEPVWMYINNSIHPEDRPVDNNQRWLRQPFQYKGQFGYFTDVHNGLCYCLNRYYDPRMGRWLTRDPIGLEGGVNVYEYCAGNPVMFADPSGLQQGLGQVGFRDWFYSTWVGQLFVGENWSRGVTTSAAALGTVVSNTAIESIKGSSPLFQHIGANWRGWDGGSHKNDLGFRSSTISWDIAGSSVQSAIGAKLPLLGGAERSGAGMTVYRSLNTAGEVQYIGRTNNFFRRLAEHANRFAIQPIRGLTGLSKDEARAVEQCLIEFHGLGKNGGTLLNKINAISRTNPIYAASIRQGASILRKAGYPGF